MTDGAVPDSLIPYDEIVQEALRAVVGRVLGSVAENGGLPGDHHRQGCLEEPHAPACGGVWPRLRYSTRMMSVEAREHWPPERGES